MTYSGLMFDLIEIVISYLGQAGLDPPLCVVGARAKASLAFANIYSNW